MFQFDLIHVFGPCSVLFCCSWHMIYAPKVQGAYRETQGTCKCSPANWVLAEESASGVACLPLCFTCYSCFWATASQHPAPLSTAQQNPSRFLSAPDSRECLQELKQIQSAPKSSWGNLIFWSMCLGALTMPTGNPKHCPCYGDSVALLELFSWLFPITTSYNWFASKKPLGSNFPKLANQVCNTSFAQHGGKWGKISSNLLGQMWRMGKIMDVK